ncbi:MAG: glycosyltransferase [Pseudomonadota bacterium]
MNVLFLHPLFPGQFRFLAEFFGKNKDHTTVFVTTDITRKESQIPGVKKIIVAEKASEKKQSEQALKSSPGRAVANLLASLKKQNFIPDIVIGQSGSGIPMYVKDVFSQIPFLSFFEWYHSADNLQESVGKGSDQELNILMSLRNKNIPILADLVSCDAGICPTQWQKNQFPEEFHKKLHIINDGIDTRLFAPLPAATFKTKDLDLSRVKQLVTYTVNLLAPYPGVDQFMASLPAVLEHKPDAHVVILGEDRVFFGDAQGHKKSYKSMILESVALDPARVHFIDRLSYENYTTLLQASTVHVYLDSPLVVSRLLLEAMACECLVIASDSPPVKEVIRDGTNGIMIDFSSQEKISQKIINCLDFPSFMEKVKQKARQTIVDDYSLEKTIPLQLGIIQKMVRQSKNKADQFG